MHFHPTGDRTVAVEGILIEGHPLLWVLKLLLGANNWVWIKGNASFVAAEMKHGAPVEGRMELQIMRMLGGKPE